MTTTVHCTPATTTPNRQLRLPIDCGCIIFHWLEQIEQVRLSRVDRYWYEISDRKQAYQRHLLPSFSKDGFDFLEYERWYSRTDRSLRLTLKELFVRSRSRVIQHQSDITLIINYCRRGNGRHYDDDIRESKFEVCLNGFRGVQCLQIEFKEMTCNCWYKTQLDLLLPKRTCGLLIRVIQTWSHQIVSFQVGSMPLFASQLFHSMDEKSISMPHLQHAAVSAEPKDVYVILKHGVGVLRLDDLYRMRIYQPPIQNSRRDVPIITDSNFFQSLSHPPYHLVLRSVSTTQLVPWCLRVLPETLRIHLQHLPLADRDGSIQWNYNKDIQMRGESSNTYPDPPMRLFQSFKSLVYEIDPFDPYEMNSFWTRLSTLIPQPYQTLSSSSSSSLTEPSSGVHPFVSVNAFTLKAIDNKGNHPPIPIHELHRIFPRLTRIHLDPLFRVDLSIDWATFTWLQHLTVGLNLSFNQSSAASERKFLHTIVLELSELRSLDLQIDLGHILAQPPTYSTTDEFGSYWEMLDCLVLSNPNLKSITLGGNLDVMIIYGKLTTTAHIRLFQRFLIYLHLLWQRLDSSHVIPVMSLHPVTRASLSPLQHPLLSRMSQLSLPRSLEVWDRLFPVTRTEGDQPSKVVTKEVNFTTRVSQWFKRPFQRGPFPEEIRAAEEMKNYVAGETASMTLRLTDLLESIGRTRIHPRVSSSFRLQLGDEVYRR